MWRCVLLPPVHHPPVLLLHLGVRSVGNQLLWMNGPLPHDFWPHQERCEQDPEVHSGKCGIKCGIYEN